MFVLWILFQSILSINNVYSKHLESIPPRILLIGLLPNLIVILFLFLSKKGKQFIDSLPIFDLTNLNSIRVLVELVLWLLFLNNVVPKLMTFEGRNLDIIAGLSAPIISYLVFYKKHLAQKSLLIWNIMSLLLLLNIAYLGIFSVPFPLQKFAFDQPNIAVLYFPFSCLPTFIVPIVLFGHLVSIRQIIKKVPNNII